MPEPGPRDSYGRARLDPGLPFVELRIPADPAYVRTARLAVGDLGGRVGFSVAELDDVRLAVDELCSLLIGCGGHLVELRVQAHDRTLFVEGSAPEVRADVALSDLSATLLHALVDSWTLMTRGREACFEMHRKAREIA